MLVKVFDAYKDALNYDMTVSSEKGYSGTTARWCEPIPMDNGTFLVASHDGEGVEVEVY